MTTGTTGYPRTYPVNLRNAQPTHNMFFMCIWHFEMTLITKALTERESRNITQFHKPEMDLFH